MKSDFKKVLAFAILCVICIHSAFAEYKVTNNPYEGIDWNVYKGYKAAFHVHSTYSDGSHTQEQMLITHYNRDYSVVTMTDHGVFNEEWHTEPKKVDDESKTNPEKNPKKHLDLSQQEQINKGEYERNGRNPTLGGMIGLTWGNEPFAYLSETIDKGHSFTANAYFNYSAKNDNLTTILQKSAAAGGINYIHHPGRYTGGKAGGTSGEAASNKPENINKYVGILRNTNALGMEIINKLDDESRSDRRLYDNILKVLAPEGRKVWAFSSDDSHDTNAVGYSFNMMFSSELSRDAITKSMKDGAFYAVARVARLEGINSSGVPNNGGGTSATLNLLKQSVPSISKIEVDKANGIITIIGEDYNTIEWIAYGDTLLKENRKAAGNTLDLNNRAYEGRIGSYVRAQLKSATGIAFTQPFYVRSNIKIDPSPVIPTGLTAIENDKLSSVNLPAGWAWVDGNQDIGEGTRVYEAIFTPSDPDVYNTVTLGVNVTGKPKGHNVYVVSKTGDYYHYFSRTNSQFLKEAFDILFVSGWPNVITPIGFGTTPTPATTIPNSPNYTWTYFTKQFTINNKNFDISELRNVSGRQRIDDAMIMYINGIEVYRFNTGTSSTKIGTSVEWDKYVGNNVTASVPAPIIEFAINSDYDDRLISGSGSSAFRDAASLTNFKKAIKSGDNTITCVVGQNSATSSDLFFDLQMDITVNEKNPQPFTNINAVTLKPATYTFNGSEQKPVLMLGTKELKEGVDYNAKYTNNINAGAVDGATVEIAGIGEYIGNATLLFTINKANQPDLNITPVTGKKFGDAPFNLSATGGNTNGTVTYELVSGPGTVTNAGGVTITGAGDIVVRATKTSNENYNPVMSAETTISVAKAQLTLKAENKTISVGDPVPTYTYIVSELVGSDTKENIITTQPTFNVANFSSSEANKTFDITISGGATTSPNYEIKTYAKGTLTIRDKSTVTISGLTAQNGIYNGNAHIGYTGTAKFTGGSPTTEPTTSYIGRSGTTYSSTSTAPTNAGDYTVKLTLDNDPGYKGEISIDFTINKASLVLKADDKTISVGESVPTYTYTVSGLVGSDTKESIITTQPTFSVANFSSSEVKTFDITISGGATTSQNYEIKTYTKGTLTVASKTVVTIEGLSAQSGPYNGKPRTGYTGTATFKNGTAKITPTVATLTGIYTGRSGTTYSSSSTAPTNAGNYTVKLTLGNDQSYKGEVSFDFTINKVSLILKADDKTISLNDPMPTYTYTVSGLVSPDTKASIITTQPTLSVANFSSSVAKTFDITISGGATTNQNYTIATRTNGTLTVNSAAQDSISSSITPILPRLPKIPSYNYIVQIQNGINLMATNRAVVEIYGLKGNLVQRQNFKSGAYSISLEHLPRGIYIAKASFGSETKTLRVVVR